MSRRPTPRPSFDAAALLDHWPSGAAVLDGSGTVVYANAALHALAACDSLEGLTLGDLNARFKGTHLAGRFARLLATREASTECETVAHGAAREGRLLRVTLAPLDGPHRSALLEIAEAAAPESRPAPGGSGLESAAAASDDAILALGPDGAIRAFNRGARRIFGYKESEFGSLTLMDLISDEAGAQRLHPSSLARAGAVRNAQTHGRTKSGRRIPVLVTATPTGGRDPTVAASVVIKELTELHELQEKTLEAARLKTVLETVVSLNHEINNPLAIVMGNLQLLLRSFEKGPDSARARLAASYEAGRRIAEVIHRLTNLVEPVETEYLSGRGIRMIDVRRSRSR